MARGKPRKTESSKLGLSFAAQPAALTIAVSFTVWLKSHLAVTRLDYSEVVFFVLAYSKAFVTLCWGRRKCSIWGCPGRCSWYFSCSLNTGLVQKNRALTMSPLALARNTIFVRSFHYLREAARKCSYLRMPWDFWLIFIALGVLLPWRGRTRMKKLLAMPRVSVMERLVLYASTIAFQWLAVAIVGWRVWAHGYTAQQLGLIFFNRTSLLIAGILGAVVIGTLQWFNLRRVSRIPPESRGPLQAVAERILPQTVVELPPYLALAITAGLCEEFLYRGFAMAALAHAGLGAWLVILISSILFGLAHSYQGRGGIVMTFIVGLILGASRLAYNSLVPAIFWHSAIDTVAGVAGRRYLKRSAAEPQGDLVRSETK